MNIRFLEIARHELDEAFEWYENQLDGLGYRFLNEIDSGVRRISGYPMSCQEVTPGIRRCLLGRFPYCLIYANDGDGIIILAVAHLHRKPKYWIERFTK